MTGTLDELGKADILSLEKVSKNIHQIYSRIFEYVTVLKVQQDAFSNSSIKAEKDRITNHISARKYLSWLGIS